VPELPGCRSHDLLVCLGLLFGGMSHVRRENIIT
jgi:hypothetical protein